MVVYRNFGLSIVTVLEISLIWSNSHFLTFKDGIVPALIWQPQYQRQRRISVVHQRTFNCIVNGIKTSFIHANLQFLIENIHPKDFIFKRIYINFLTFQISCSVHKDQTTNFRSILSSALSIKKSNSNYRLKDKQYRLRLCHNSSTIVSFELLFEIFLNELHNQR